MFSLSSLLIVLFPLVIMYSTIEHPFFQNKIAPLIATDIGFLHYAEFRYHRASNCSMMCSLINTIGLNYSWFGKSELIGNPMETWRVACLCMPLNTVVNLFYPLVGVYWLRRFYSAPMLYFLYESTTQLLFLMEAFSWMAVLYGPLQCSRILQQTTSSAILDQWVTLPFFSSASLIGFLILKRQRTPPASESKLVTPSCDTCFLSLTAEPYPLMFAAAFMAASIASYGLALFHPLGFEVALALHFALATAVCFALVQRSPAALRPHLLRALLPLCLSLVGFAALKLGEPQLETLAPTLFGPLSGHLLSKVADALQIHFFLLLAVRSAQLAI